MALVRTGAAALASAALFGVLGASAGYYDTTGAGLCNKASVQVPDHTEEIAKLRRDIETLCLTKSDKRAAKPKRKVA